MATISTPRAELRFKHAISALRRLGPSTVVEIGPGTGQMLPRLASVCTEVVGVEISDMARRQATEAAAGLSNTRLVADVADLDGCRFDVVIALEVIEHIERDVDALREWRELLRPGGVLLLSTPAHEKRWTQRDVEAGHYRRYERSQLAGALKASGWARPRIDVFGGVLKVLLGPLSLGNRHDLATDTPISQRTQSSSLNSIRRHGRVAPIVSAIVRLLAFVAYWCERPLRRSEVGDGYFVIAQNPQ